ncbi:hypothetical protein B0H19DRAFT_1333854 [Mycena capillaripes]|nr:hypothetical protein B0H19DRAFT_1333854 [Mycena capillaripes]
MSSSIIPECLPILYPPEILPHQKQGILPTTVFVALHTLKCLDGLVAIEYSQTVRHLSVNRNSSTAFSNCQRIQICGDMTCLLYMVCLRPSFIVLYTDNLLSPGSIHYLNDRVITFYRLKPPSLPNAAYNGNAGRNWNCGPMSLCLGGGSLKLASIGSHSLTIVEQLATIVRQLSEKYATFVPSPRAPTIWSVDPPSPLDSPACTYLGAQRAPRTFPAVCAASIASHHHADPFSGPTARHPRLLYAARRQRQHLPVRYDMPAKSARAHGDDAQLPFEQQLHCAPESGSHCAPSPCARELGVPEKQRNADPPQARAALERRYIGR